MDNMKEVKDGISTLTLAYTRDTGTLTIGGEVPCIDMAISICQQAIREFEKQLRQQAALQLQESIRKAEEDKRIHQLVRGHHA